MQSSNPGLNEATDEMCRLLYKGSKPLNFSLRMTRSFNGWQLEGCKPLPTSFINKMASLWVGTWKSTLICTAVSVLTCNFTSRYLGRYEYFSQRYGFPNRNHSFGRQFEPLTGIKFQAFPIIDGSKSRNTKKNSQTISMSMRQRSQRPLHVQGDAGHPC
jgi:hypothetical protein